MAGRSRSEATRLVDALGDESPGRRRPLPSVWRTGDDSATLPLARGADMAVNSGEGRSATDAADEPQEEEDPTLLLLLAFESSV